MKISTAYAARASEMWLAACDISQGQIGSASDVLRRSLPLGVEGNTLFLALPAGVSEDGVAQDHVQALKSALRTVAGWPMTPVFFTREAVVSEGIQLPEPPDPLPPERPKAGPQTALTAKQRGQVGGRERTWAPGSAAVLDTMLRPGGPAISGDAILVYLTLFSYMGSDFISRPSIPTIAEGAKLSERYVRYKLDELEAAGLVERRYQSKRSLMFLLHAPWGADPAHRAGSRKTTLHTVQGQEGEKPIEEAITLHSMQGGTVESGASVAQTLHTVQGDADRVNVGTDPTLHVVHSTLHAMQGDPAQCAVQETHRRNPLEKPNEEVAVEKRPSWREWWDRKTGGLYSNNDKTAVLDNAICAGMDDELVILAIQRCLDEKKRVPLSFAATLVGTWRAAGVMNVEALREYEERQGEMEVASSERRSDQHGGGPASADRAAAGVRVEAGGRYQGGAVRHISGRRALRRPEPAGATRAESSKWVLPEHRSGD